MALMQARVYTVATDSERKAVERAEVRGCVDRGAELEALSWASMVIWSEREERAIYDSGSGSLGHGSEGRQGAGTQELFLHTVQRGGGDGRFQGRGEEGRPGADGIVRQMRSPGGEGA